MIQRLKNKWFLGALAGLVYQIIEHFGVNIDVQSYQTGIDIVCYALIGIGIHTDFNSPPSK